MADFVKKGSSNTKVGEAVAASHEKVSDHEVVKINDHTEAVFNFEVLKNGETLTFKRTKAKELFAEILGKDVSISKKTLINEHIDRLLTKYDDKTVAITFRKQLCLYLKGEKNSSEFKQQLFTYKDTYSVKKAINEFFKVMLIVI